MSQKKISTEIGKIYKIESESAGGKYYIGSTFLKLNDRMTRHKAHYKMMLAGNAKKYTAHEILKYNDCIITCLKQFDGITKRELLNEETQTIMFHKKKYNDDIVNKCNTGLTLNIKQYLKNYKENHPEKMEAYKQKFDKKYYANYYKKNKDHLNFLKRTNRKAKIRSLLVEKLNNGENITEKRKQKYGILKITDGSYI